MGWGRGGEGEGGGGGLSTKVQLPGFRASRIKFTLSCCGCVDPPTNKNEVGAKTLSPRQFQPKWYPQQPQNPEPSQLLLVAHLGLSTPHCGGT